LAEERLLDTVTLSEVIKGRDPHVAQRAHDYLALHGRFIFSIITRYEILRGLKAKDATRQLDLFEAQCQSSLVLPLSDEIVVKGAEIYGHLHRRGQLIGDVDTLIAATALVCGFPVVTENRAHFERVPGLAIESWRSG